MQTIEIRNLGRPPGSNELKRMNRWEYKNVREKWEMMLLAIQVPNVKTPCCLTFTVFSSRALDWDNACSCAKIPLDALQRIGKLEDDSPEFIVEFVPKQERCKRTDAGIRMVFMPVEACGE